MWVKIFLPNKAVELSDILKKACINDRSPTLQLRGWEKHPVRTFPEMSITVMLQEEGRPGLVRREAGSSVQKEVHPSFNFQYHGFLCSNGSLSCRSQGFESWDPSVPLDHLWNWFWSEWPPSPGAVWWNGRCPGSCPLWKLDNEEPWCVTTEEAVGKSCFSGLPGSQGGGTFDLAGPVNYRNSAPCQQPALSTCVPLCSRFSCLIPEPVLESSSQCLMVRAVCGDLMKGLVCSHRVSRGQASWPPLPQPHNKIWIVGRVRWSQNPQQGCVSWQCWGLCPRLTLSVFANTFMFCMHCWLGSLMSLNSCITLWIR